MENTTPSKISVLFGSPIESNEQSSIQVNFVISEPKAKEQIEKLKELTSNQEIDSSSIVLVFPCQTSNRKALKDVLEELIQNPRKTKFGTLIGDFLYPLDSHCQLSMGQDCVVVTIKPPEDMVELLEEQWKDLKWEVGVEEAVENQENGFVINIKSLSTFDEIEDTIDNGGSFNEALLKSLLLEASINLNPTFISTVLGVLKSFAPQFGDPLGFLEFFQSMNIDLKFSSSAEIPDSIRNQLFPKGTDDGFRISKDEVQNDKMLCRRLFELIDVGVELFATFDKGLVLNVKTNLPGFARHCGKLIIKKEP